MFEVRATDGNAARYELMLDDVPMFIQFVAMAAYAAAETRSQGQPTDLAFKNKELPLFPIPTTQIGLSTSDEPGRAVIVARMFDVDLAIECDSSTARRIVGDTSNIVPL